VGRTGYFLDVGKRGFAKLLMRILSAALSLKWNETNNTKLIHTSYFG